MAHSGADAGNNVQHLQRTISRDVRTHHTGQLHVVEDEPDELGDSTTEPLDPDLYHQTLGFLLQNPWNQVSIYTPNTTLPTHQNISHNTTTQCLQKCLQKFLTA